MITLELIVMGIILMAMLPVIIVSYGIQQEKHKRHREWMKQQLKQDRSYTND